MVYSTVKFDYLFLKEVGNNYKIGFGLALGDSINVSAMGGYGGVGTYITLIEVGFNAELVFFFNKFQFFISPNFFIGFLKYTTSWMFLNVKGEIITISHIIGGFFEVCINVTPYRTNDSFFLNIGFEYRIGRIK